MSDLSKSLALVVAALKKKKRPTLAQQLYQALGIEFDVDTNITDNEMDKELSGIQQFIPTVEGSTNAQVDMVQLVTDLFARNKVVTAEVIEAAAQEAGVSKDELINQVCEVTQSFWSAADTEGPEEVHNAKKPKKGPQRALAIAKAKEVATVKCVEGGEPATGLTEGQSKAWQLCYTGYAETAEEVLEELVDEAKSGKLTLKRLEVNDVSE